MSGRNQVVGSFSDSSQHIELKHGHILKAKCKNSRGDWVDSEIDLNSCIGNLNGKGPEVIVLTYMADIILQVTSPGTIEIFATLHRISGSLRMEPSLRRG